MWKSSEFSKYRVKYLFTEDFFLQSDQILNVIMYQRNSISLLASDST